MRGEEEEEIKNRTPRDKMKRNMLRMDFSVWDQQNVMFISNVDSWLHLFMCYMRSDKLYRSLPVFFFLFLYIQNQIRARKCLVYFNDESSKEITHLVQTVRCIGEYYKNLNIVFRKLDNICCFWVNKDV